MNFCSHCGSDALDFIIPEGDHLPRYVCSNCGTIHYQNPKLIVGCLPVYEGKVMLCRRAIEPRYGYWNLPAGFMESIETAEEGAKREVFEETGATVEIQRLHVVYSIPKVSHVYLHFLADIKDGYFVEKTAESLEVKLFDEKDIPWDEIAFHSTTFALQKYFENPEEKEVRIGSLVLNEE
ncbi:NUDIX hydrolase [Sediminitomix flava]|nr:NUDIX hydrolase [Sediminitomix flava]